MAAVGCPDFPRSWDQLQRCGSQSSLCWGLHLELCLRLPVPPLWEDGLSPSLHPTGTIWGTVAALLRARGWGWCCVSRIRAGPDSSCLLGGVSPWGGEMPSVPRAGWRQHGSKAHFAEAEAGLGRAGKGWGSLGSARGFGAGRGSPALGVCRAPCLGNGVEYRYRGWGAGRGGESRQRCQEGLQQPPMRLSWHAWAQRGPGDPFVSPALRVQAPRALCIPKIKALNNSPAPAGGEDRARGVLARGSLALCCHHAHPLWDTSATHVPADRPGLLQAAAFYCHWDLGAAAGGATAAPSDFPAQATGGMRGKGTEVHAASWRASSIPKFVR